MALRGAEGTLAALVECFDEVPPLRRPEDLGVAPQALSQLRVVRLAFLTRAVGTRYCTASLVGVFISTVLKVTYHGSDTYLLNAVVPQQLQAGDSRDPGGRGQLLRLPYPLNARTPPKSGAEVFRNDEHGDVVVTIRDDSVEDGATTKGG